MTPRFESRVTDAGGVRRWIPPVWQFNEEELELFAAMIAQQSLEWAVNSSSPDLTTLLAYLGVDDGTVAKIQQSSP